MIYGIKIPLHAVQFGKSVNMLDITAYLDENNVIHYRGFTKPTDSKQYLNPKSFHPRSVFDSVPFSQLLRTIRNNSKEETKMTEIEQCIKDFTNSGYDAKELETVKNKAIAKANNIQNETDQAEAEDTLVFPLHFFDKLKEFKSVVYSLKQEMNELVGDTRVTFAVKKHSSIGNMMIRNKELGIKENTTNGQRCNAPGCRQCPLVNDEHRFTINGKPLIVPRNLNCKSKNIIYLWLCKLCFDPIEPYFGRTTQACHNRTSGHRSCFTHEEKLDKSALSMHANDKHQNNFSLSNFNISVVKKVSAQRIRREEFKFIDKYRTASLGLNRYKS